MRNRNYPRHISALTWLIFIALSPLFITRGAVAEDFTIIALTDTQKYPCGAAPCSRDSSIFAAQTQGIVDNKDPMNIAFVTHPGDFVENSKLTLNSTFLFVDPGTNIAVVGGNLSSPFEPSGAAWHSRLQKLFIVDDGGKIAQMDSDGTNVVEWHPDAADAADQEGICVADPDSDLVYVGVEREPGSQFSSIREFNFVTGVVTRTFDLNSWMGLPGNRNQQLEALTFVPDLADPEGGLFYAGRQNDGKIFVFRLPIVSSVTATEVEFVTTITPEVGLTDISGLYYHQANGLLYGIFDSSNLLVAMNTVGTTVMQRDLDGNNQEGFTIGENGEVFVSEDHGEVWRYMFADIPLADAGEDETVTDSNGDGTYAYALDGSGSTSMSSISSYKWYEGVTLLATGVSPVVGLAVGVHTITLIVMNEQTVTDDDILEITVLPASNDCNGDLDDDGDVDGADLTILINDSRLEDTGVFAGAFGTVCP